MRLFPLTNYALLAGFGVADPLTANPPVSDPLITAAPEVQIELFRKQNNNRFMGWVSVSGTYSSYTCSVGNTYFQSGSYWGCCTTTAASCNAPIGCVGGSLIYRTASGTQTSTLTTKACTSTGSCNTGFLYENTADPDALTNIFCGVGSVNWSYYRARPEITSSATKSSSSPSSSVPQFTSASPTGTSVLTTSSPTKTSGLSVLITISTYSLSALTTTITSGGSAFTTTINSGLSALITTITSGLSAPSTSPQAEPEPEKKGGSKVWIAGVVAGPIVALALGAIIFFCFRRKKKMTPSQAPMKQKTFHDGPEPSYPGSPNPGPYSQNAYYDQQHKQNTVPFGVAPQGGWAPQPSGAHGLYEVPSPQQQWQPMHQQGQQYPPPMHQNVQTYQRSEVENRPFSAELDGGAYQNLGRVVEAPEQHRQ